MLFRIPITIDERGNVRKDIMVLGRENENLSKTLSITIPKSIEDKCLYIEFENDNKFISPRLEVDNCKINYDIPQSLMKKGNLKCQVVASDADNVVWKSNNFEFQIYSSINATEQVVETSPNILNSLQTEIDQVKKEVAEISGIDGGHLATDEDIKNLQKQLDSISVEETDPTVPSHVKNITEADINDWNKVKTLGDVFRYKGSVPTYADLPTENKVGDVYDVAEAYGNYGAGTNYAWTDKGTWDALGSDLSNYVKNTDYATYAEYGLVKLGSTYYGLEIRQDGSMGLNKATNNEINNRYGNKALLTSHLDYAIKVGLTTNTETLTEEEKIAAQTWLGITDLINTSIVSVLNTEV